MENVDLVRHASSVELAADAAHRWLEQVEAAGRRGTRFHVALPGGRITRNFFDAAVAVVHRQHASLGHVHFFWGDERCVPPDDPDSNFGLARRHLLEPLGIAPTAVHRIQGELEPQVAARAAEAEARCLLPTDAAGWPVFDLVVLGMGEDGHVASLFPPVAEAPSEQRAVYLPVIGPKPPPRRITLSYPVLAAARQVWVLVSGAGKGQALQASLAGGRTPLGHLLRRRARTLILTDLPSE